MAKSVREDEAVFVLGVPRSGTSVLYRTLQSLPEFAIDGEVGKVDLTETHMFSRSLAARMAIQTIAENKPRAYSYYRDDQEIWQRYCACVGPLRERQTIWLKILSRSGFGIEMLERSAARGGIVWRLMRDPAVFRCYFYYSRFARGTERILEKTPEHVLHLPKIWATFPNARVIGMMRHPVDTYASLRKRRQREVAAKGAQAKRNWLTQGPEEFCERYLRIAATVKHHVSRSAERFQMVRYEDLTADKESTLRQVFRFIGASSGDAFREEPKYQISGHVEHRREKTPLLFQPIQSRESQWRQYLSNETAEKIELGLRTELDWLGYDTYTA